MLALMTALGLLTAFTPAASAEESTCTRAEIPRCEGQTKKPAPPGSITDLSPLRQSIVMAAQGEIGIVSNLQDTDCNKRGWSRLERYYAVARAKTLTVNERRIIKRPLRADGDSVKINDWCGLFALWAVKTGARAEQSGQPTSCDLSQPTPGAGQKDFRGYLDYVYWRNSADKNGLYGLPLKFGHQGILPGDIVLIRGDLNHHAVVERVVGDKIYTIDGNMDCQMVVRKERPMSEVSGYYQVE